MYDRTQDSPYCKCGYTVKSRNHFIRKLFCENCSEAYEHSQMKKIVLVFKAIATKTLVSLQLYFMLSQHYFSVRECSETVHRTESFCILETSKHHSSVTLRHNLWEYLIIFYIFCYIILSCLILISKIT